jgi:branched-chain amino acid transport system permease protein
MLATLSFEGLAQQFIYGIQLGAIYALIALGYTMVYGVLKLINFAHGDVYMVGAYLAYYTCSVWLAGVAVEPHLMLVIMLLVSMCGCALLGLLIERIAYRPLRSAPRISVLITAIGVSLFIEYAGKLFFQTSPQPSIKESVNVFKDQIHLGRLEIAESALIVLITTVVLMCLLWYFVTRTAMGRAMRAVSHDFNTAALMGISVDKVITITFLIGSALAGAGGMMQATSVGTPLSTFYGLMPGVKAFVAAVLGGIGNIPGAVTGAMIMAMAETAVKAFGYSNYTDAVAFIILIGILLLRPGGLFGAVTEKV